MSKIGSFLYVIRNERGGIEQGEIPAHDEVDASHRLVKHIDKPYKLLALKDQTLDKAIISLSQYLKQRRGN